jgi:drug/metabolite transporter (DMT)-like permease
MQNDNLKSYLHLHLIVFIWGFTAVLGKLISLSALDLVWYRMLLATFFIFIYIKWKKIDLTISRTLLLQFAFSGVVIALHWFTFYEAIKVSNVSLTLACLATGAFFVSIIEPIIYKKKVNWFNMFLGVFVVIGLYFVAFSKVIEQYGFFKSFYYLGHSSLVNGKGVALALVSAFLSALFSVINSRFAKVYEPSYISFYELFCAVILMSIFMLFGGNFSVAFFTLTNHDIFWLVLLSLFCTAYAFVASVKVMKFLSPFTVMLTINLEPIYGIVLALLVFKESEKMDFYFYIGAAVILCSVILNGIVKNRMK